MKNYKIIQNFNTENETTTYFDRLTKSKLQLLNDNYVLLSYTPLMGCYMAIDYKLNENDKKVFNACPSQYCSR